MRNQHNLDALRDGVSVVMDRLKMPHTRIRSDTLSTTEWRMTFYAGKDLDLLCGVRADLMFVRFSEWTQDDTNTVLKPLLMGSIGLRRLRLEQTLVDQGLMLETERRPYPTVDDILINLD